MTHGLQPSWLKRGWTGLALLLVLTSAVANAGDQLLAAGDRIRVDVFARPDLSIEQDIQPSGAVRLPLVGEVPAAGLSLETVEEVIARTLAGGVEASPSVMVTVVRWRPVYVLGEVRTPRAIEYTADLTVLKAVALAGGFGPPSGGELTWVDAFRSRERLDTAVARYDRLRARRVRLLAERDGLEEVQYPSGGEATGDIVAILDTELRLFRARKERLTAQLSSLDGRANSFHDEIAALETQRTTLDEELRIAAADLEASRALSEQGLEVRARNSAIQRDRLDVLSRLAENASFTSRATANLQEAQQGRASASIDREQSVLEELAETEAELTSTEHTILAESRILGQSRQFDLDGQPGQESRQQTSIEIVRGNERFSATETTPLIPGDVVRIGTEESMEYVEQQPSPNPAFQE